MGFRYFGSGGMEVGVGSLHAHAPVSRRACVASASRHVPSRKNDKHKSSAVTRNGRAV